MQGKINGDYIEYDDAIRMQKEAWDAGFDGAIKLVNEIIDMLFIHATEMGQGEISEERRNGALSSLVATRGTLSEVLEDNRANMFNALEALKTKEDKTG